MRGDIELMGRIPPVPPLGKTRTTVALKLGFLELFQWIGHSDNNKSEWRKSKSMGAML